MLGEARLREVIGAHIGRANVARLLGRLKMLMTLEKPVVEVGTLPDECRAIIRKNMDHYDKPWEIHKIYGMTVFLLLNYDCNLRCSYCYQPTKFKATKGYMTPEIVDDAMTFIANSLREDKVRFNFFGGEPLLNAGTLKYTIENYPMFKYLVTTNGLLLKTDPDLREWFLKQTNLSVSLSIGGLRTVYKENFIEEIRPCLEVVKNNGGDIHYVIADPTDPTVMDDVVALFSMGLPLIRLSMTRHTDNLLCYQDDYIKLFKRLADYIYFGDKPILKACNWDTALRNNIYKKLRGEALTPVPPTFCGAGCVYLTVTPSGDIYPCDLFTCFPQFRLGDVWKGLNDTSIFFRKMKDWKDELYGDCRTCKIVDDGDIRLCPKAMCLAENYAVNGSLLKPASLHCVANKIDYELFTYIAKKAIEKGISYFGLNNRGEQTC